MPNPNRSDLHVDSLLTNVSVAVLQQETTFVANRIFAPVPVSKQSDLYAVYNAGDFHRDDMQVRAPGTESAGGGYRVDPNNRFFCQVYALHKDIADQEREAADPVFQLNRDATVYLTLKAQIKKERVFAQNYLTPGVWGTDLTGVPNPPIGLNQFLQWNDSNSTPIEDIRKAITLIAETGLEPNILILGRTVYDKLIDHPEIVDRVKYGTQSGERISTIGIPELAKLFRIDQVLVMSAVVNTAAEGQPTLNNFINSNNALLAYKTPTPGRLVPSAGYDFQWRGLYRGNNGQRIKNFRLEWLDSDRIEIEQAFDLKVVAPSLGVFFSNAVASL